MLSALGVEAEEKITVFVAGSVGVISLGTATLISMRQSIKISQQQQAVAVIGGNVRSDDELRSEKDRGMSASEIQEGMLIASVV